MDTNFEVMRFFFEDRGALFEAGILVGAEGLRFIFDEANDSIVVAAEMSECVGTLFREASLPFPVQVRTRSYAEERHILLSRHLDEDDERTLLATF